MFNIFKGKSDSLKVTLDRPSGVYYPGETLTAVIHFQSDKDVKARQGLVVLQWAEQYDFQSMEQTTDSDGSTSSELRDHRRTDEHEIDRLAFAFEETLAGGQEHTYTFTAVIPNPAPPTIDGKIIKVYWNVKARIDRKLAADFNAETNVIVLAPPVAEAPLDLVGKTGEAEQAEMFVELPSESWMADSAIKGELLIRPLQKFDATQVRLELVRREEVTYDYGLDKEEVVTVKLAGKTDLEPGRELRLPFQVALPPGCSPSAQGDSWKFTWILRGVLARFLRKDVFVEREIKVYNGKTA